MSEPYSEFELMVDDEMVAGVSGPESVAWREILHYASQYAEDGELSIVRVTREVIARPWVDWI